MNIQKDLKKDGIEVIEKVHDLISNTVLKSVARRIVETFPDYEFSEKGLFEKFSNLTLYKAKMPEGMAEANYFYKNTSIYFNEHVNYEDLEEFSIHECLHFLQEKKDDDGNLLRMGLCNYKGAKPYGLALNEAAVQTIASRIIGIDPDFEKYYGITLYTPSPSYYPVECSLLSQIMYFTGEDILYKSTIFSTDDFKDKIIEMSSEKVYLKLQHLFDDILKCEEHIIILNNKISDLEDGSSKIDNLSMKVDKLKNKIFSDYFVVQNTIIKVFFDYYFSQISNLEELDVFRHKIYKYSNIIGSYDGYDFFDNYYALMMNKLEHKCNILENGGVETALSNDKPNPFISLLRKIFKFKKEERIKI